MFCLCIFSFFVTDYVYFWYDTDLIGCFERLHDVLFKMLLPEVLPVDATAGTAIITQSNLVALIYGSGHSASCRDVSAASDP